MNRNKNKAQFTEEDIQKLFLRKCEAYKSLFSSKTKSKLKSNIQMLILEEKKSYHRVAKFE